MALRSELAIHSVCELIFIQFVLELRVVTFYSEAERKRYLRTENKIILCAHCDN